MSQHRYQTTYKKTPVLVLMGWDRRLQGFFLVVEDTNSNDDSYVYSNLGDPELQQWMGLPPSIEYFLSKLQSMEISIPQEMIDDIQSDKLNNVGNKTVSYASK